MISGELHVYHNLAHLIVCVGCGCLCCIIIKWAWLLQTDSFMDSWSVYGGHGGSQFAWFLLILDMTIIMFLLPTTAATQPHQLDSFILP